VLVPRPCGRSIVAALAAVLLSLLALLAPAREADTLPGFLHEALGPPQADAPLLHHPADGVRVAVKSDRFSVVRGSDSVSLAVDGTGNAEWKHFENGVTRSTPFGAETVVVDADKTEQYLTVTERQGTRTWRWSITAEGLEPRLMAGGAVEFLRDNERSGLRILPARIYAPSGRDITPTGTRWSLTGIGNSHRLELRLDDARLPLPYVIDPAVDYPSPLYLSNASSTVGGSWQLSGTANLLGDSSTRTSLCKNCVGYVQWQPGVDNGVAGTPGSTPTGHGWIVDAAGGTGFPAGSWSFTVETDIPDLLLAPGQAILAVGVWKGTVAGGAFTPTQTLLPPTDDPAGQDLRTSILPVTTTVTYSLPQFPLAASETLYVEYWRKQVVGLNDTNLARRYLDFIVNDGVAKIVHPVADDVAPTHALGVIEGERPDLQHFDSATDTLYYNPAATGDFTLTDTLADSGSGPYSVAFPGLSVTGFSGIAVMDTASPFLSNVYSFDAANTSAPAPMAIIGEDNAFNSSTASFPLVRDTTAPAGGFVSYPDGLDSDGVVTITTSDGTDGDAGVNGASGVLERQLAPLTSDTCGAFGGWVAVTSPDTVPPGNCATYRYRVSDNVGNEAVYTSPNVVKVGAGDATPPSAPALTLTESEPDEHVAGTTLYYNPSGSNTGTFTVDAYTGDAESGISLVEFPAVFGLDGAIDPLAPYQTTYWWTATATATGDYSVSAVNGAALQASSTFMVVPDTGAPTVSLTQPAIGAPIREGQTLSATADDSLAGVREIEFAYCPGSTCSWLVATPLGIDTSAPYSIPWTGQPADGEYTILAVATDNVGNGAASTGVTITVDNTAPSNSLAVVEGSRPDLQYFDDAATAVYYNPAATGDLRLNAAPSDAAGIQMVEFPSVSTPGFTGTGASDGLAPYESNSYSFGSTNMTAPAPADVVVTDLAGNTGSTELSFIRDTDPPSGGDVSYSDGYDADGSVAITTADGMDSAAGIDVDSRLLERQTAPLANGSCGAFGSWTQVTSPDLLPSGTCARYRYRVADRVANTATFTSSNVVKVDLSAPLAPVLALSESEPDEHVDGTTLYYNPSGENSGTFSVAAVTSDSESSVAQVSFQAVFGADASTATAAPYETNYSWTASATASGASTVEATNAAGLTASASFNVMPDTSGPDILLSAPADGAAMREGQAVEAAAFDTLAGTAGVEFRYCPGDTCAWDVATPLGSDGSAPYSAAWNTQPADGTHTLIARAVDNVGNHADAAPITVTVDNTAPSNVVVPAEAYSPELQHFEDATDTLYYNPAAGGGFVLSSAADDTGSGVAGVDFPRISITGFRGAAASDFLAPFTSNIYSFDDTNSVAPTDATIVVTDVAGNRTTETLSFERDTAPPTGGFVSYADGYHSNGSVDVQAASGTDAGVGIEGGSAVLERETAVLEGGVCGAYSAWEPSVSPDSLSDAICARYRYRVSDQVGNEAVYTSEDVVRTDFTPPTAELTDPGTILHGTVDLSASADDIASGVATLTYQASPTGADQWTDVAASWDTTSVADGLYDLRVVVSDGAGNTTASAAIQERLVDNTAPGVQVTAPVGYLNGGAADPYIVEAASPDSDVANVEFFRCDDASVDCSTGGWLSLGVDASAPFAASWNLDADGNRALKALAVDTGGNASDTVVNVTIDRQAPSNGSLSASHTTSTWSGDNTVDVAFEAPTDAISGADGFSYQWDTDPSATPDVVKDAEETAGGTTSPPLGDGAWYFHLRTADNAGNWSDTIHAGPFLIDANAPTAVAVGGGALLQPFNLTRTFSISWSGGDGASGTAGYDVQYRSAGYNGVFGAPVLWQAATTATSASFTGSPGSTYCFSTRALDAVGNLSPWSAESCTALPLKNTSLSHSTGWSKQTGSGYYMKSYSISSRQGASLTRTGVVTRRIAVVVTKCPTCGTLGVYWSGTLLKKINLAATATRKKQLITVAGWASSRSGTVKLVVLSSGKPVMVEGLGLKAS
jgi:hypothetical protein